MAAPELWKDNLDTKRFEKLDEICDRRPRVQLILSVSLFSLTKSSLHVSHGNLSRVSSLLGFSSVSSSRRLNSRHLDASRVLWKSPHRRSRSREQFPESQFQGTLSSKLLQSRFGNHTDTDPKLAQPPWSRSPFFRPAPLAPAEYGALPILLPSFLRRDGQVKLDDRA